MKVLVHALEGAAVALLAQAPALLSSHAVQNFVGKHPADALLVPVAAGVLSAAYRWAKARWQKPAQVASTPPAPPAAPAA